MYTPRPFIVLLALATFSGSAIFAGSDPVPWMTNDREALEAAEVTHRPVLIFFTGSDWCVWSDKMEEEIFSTPEFARYADRYLVLLKLEFPRSYELPEAQMKQNRNLRRRYGVSGYPTVVVTDSNGLTLGRLTYHTGGPLPFLGELSKLIE